ncbi:MAG: hypothetical protein JWN86_707 [Planctomycetota bacterium]|nr:hypothetical protein [Planctomycetota bacterium]
MIVVLDVRENLVWWLVGGLLALALAKVRKKSEAAPATDQPGILRT